MKKIDARLKKYSPKFDSDVENHPNDLVWRQLYAASNNNYIHNGGTN